MNELINKSTLSGCENVPVHELVLGSQSLTVLSQLPENNKAY